MRDWIALRDKWQRRIDARKPSLNGLDAGYLTAAMGFVAELNDIIASKEKPASGVQSNG